MAATEMREPPAEQIRPPILAMEMDAAQAARRRAEQFEDTCFTVVLAGMAFFMLCFVGWLIWAISTYKEPEYSVAIAAVSGLDPAPDDRPVLDPEFNLTVRITVRSQLFRSCDESRTMVEVSFHGFTLASASAPQVCRMGAEEGRAVARTVVARGTRVWLPGPALDSLAADVRRAAAVFNVTLTIPGYTKRSHHDDDGLAVSCVDRPIGDDGGSALCDVSGLHIT